MTESKDDLNQIKARVEEHTIDIVNLQNDFKNLGKNVEKLTNEVSSLSSSLQHLDKTVDKATTAFNTVILLLKVIASAITFFGSVYGIIMMINR